MTASPTQVGAGPINLVIANVSGSEQRVEARVRRCPGPAEPGTTRTTGPIDPSGTATLKADVEPGRYSIRVEGDAIAPATLEVGAPRESAQDALDLPVAARVTTLTLDAITASVKYFRVVEATAREVSRRRSPSSSWPSGTA